jgi:hypothetical protein
MVPCNDLVAFCRGRTNSVPRGSKVWVRAFLFDVEGENPDFCYCIWLRSCTDRTDWFLVHEKASLLGGQKDLELPFNRSFGYIGLPVKSSIRIYGKHRQIYVQMKQQVVAYLKNCVKANK